MAGITMFTVFDKSDNRREYHVFNFPIGTVVYRKSDDNEEFSFVKEIKGLHCENKRQARQVVLDYPKPLIRAIP